MEQLFTDAILPVLIMLAIAAITATASYAATYLGRWLNARYDGQMLDNIRTKALEVVLSVEQMVATSEIAGTNKDRYEYAAGVLREFFPKLTDTQIKSAIEGALRFLKSGLQNTDK